MNKALVVLDTVLVIVLVVVVVQFGRMRSELGERALVLESAQKDLAAARADADAQKAEASKARAETESMEKALAEAQSVAERAQRQAEAAWQSRDALYGQLEALEKGLKGELGQLAEAGKEKSESGVDIENRPLMELMKNLFGQEAMKNAMKMALPMQLNMMYGQFLDQYVKDPQQRAEVEAIIKKMLEAEWEQLQEAFAAWPDTSKLENLDAAEPVNREALRAALSQVLDASQMAAFESGQGRMNENMQNFATDMQLQMAGIKLTDDQKQAFTTIIAEEGLASQNWAPDYAKDTETLKTLTLGEYLQKESERVDRVCAKLAEVLSPEDVQRYRTLWEKQLELMRMQFAMLAGGGGG